MPTIVDCPQSNLGEWRFNLFDIPVAVKWWFWLACGLTATSQPTTEGIVIWVAACFISILVHEIGHVLELRAVGMESDVVLYGWGGLTIPVRPIRGMWNRVLVALAGPAAGFCVATLLLVGTALAGAHIVFSWRTLIPGVAILPPSGNLASGGVGYLALNIFLFVNFYWSLANLLPVYPLDGGQVARALFEQADPYRGRRKSLILSASTSIAIALAGVLDRDAYLVVIFAVLAVASFQGLEQTAR
ncbi:MAG TPA: site-2 protease family protein [Verrucomicrobiae bacterium]|nr:site-2 protease family protein [Verrucomicrobiae bacterium]